MADRDPDGFDRPVRCTICNGRGAIRCECWPADCICGFDDEPCDACEGTGWLHRDDDDHDDHMPGRDG